jgi:RNA polymerase sigma factor (sigma-70 family)
VLRKFGGVSSFKGFIVVVINNLFLDWRIKEWGKWRPTPLAGRLGRIAVELERLVLRDDLEYGQAVQLLMSKGLAASEAECDEIWQQLRRRARRRRASLDEVEPPAIDTSDPIEQEERRTRARRAVDAMHAAMAQLPAQDQLIFKMRYQDDVSVARIAKLIATEQKPLYRRFEHIAAQLKASILAAGLTESDIDDLFRGFEFGSDEDDPNSSAAGLGNRGNGSSIHKDAGGVPV